MSLGKCKIFKLVSSSSWPKFFDSSFEWIFYQKSKYWIKNPNIGFFSVGTSLPGFPEARMPNSSLSLAVGHAPGKKHLHRARALGPSAPWRFMLPTLVPSLRRRATREKYRFLLSRECGTVPGEWKNGFYSLGIMSSRHRTRGIRKI